MDFQKLKRFLCAIAIGYWLLVVMIYGIAREQFNGATAYASYWFFVSLLFVLAFIYVMKCLMDTKRAKNNPVMMLYTMVVDYGFLLKQLIARDFKTKYKRSVLGMAWSFLNPLITMLVQFFVFSQIFQSNIDNYPVYLLCGIVFFNFFTEATSMGMTSISGNASLINKVYVPKYIYPFSRVLSSLVNFALAFLPLLLVMVFTGTRFAPSMLLLLFDLLCFFAFVVGIVLLLSTSMVFFRDTQFLWGVVSMIWMYMTPIFYPESIVPVQYQTLYRINPLYQFITFARIAIIDGISPAPATYVWCLLSGVSALLVGTWVFYKKQDSFIMYL